jgi:hypothetical protein
MPHETIQLCFGIISDVLTRYSLERFLTMSTEAVVQSLF